MHEKYLKMSNPDQSDVCLLLAVSIFTVIRFSDVN